MTVIFQRICSISFIPARQIQIILGKMFADDAVKLKPWIRIVYKMMQRLSLNKHSLKSTKLPDFASMFWPVNL